jgi:hypothetical protein
VKPPLGPLKKISTIEEKTTSQTESSDLIDDSKAFVELLGPTVIWRLPRGFVLLDDLEKEPGPSWATVASYYDYGGKWVHSTHYHESYRWDEKRNAINDQCAKLGVPRGDWFLARPLIDFMMQVREGKVTISSDGKVTGAYVFDPLCVTVHPPGKVNLPKRPAQYRRLAASGRIRDLAVEADDFVTRAENRGMRPEPWETNFDEKVKRLRREVRVEVHRILSEKHPAVKNLEEIILQYSSEPDSYLSWLREFRSATWEAARCVEDQTS